MARFYGRVENGALADRKLYFIFQGAASEKNSKSLKFCGMILLVGRTGHKGLLKSARERGGITMELETLRKNMVAAMKAKDKPRKEAISSLISAVKKVGIDAGCREDIPEEMVDQTILKELKTVKEQIDTCPESRTDLLEEYKFRYEVIKAYAPAQMGAEEVEKYILDKFADVAATKNKGQIMKAVMGDLKGKADGKLINQVVAKLCQ